MDKEVNIGQKAYDFSMVSQAALKMNELRNCSTYMWALIPVHMLSTHLSHSKPINPAVHDELTSLCGLLLGEVTPLQ